MEKIPIYMDLVAGILLALDLFQNYGIVKTINDKITGFVKKINTKDLKDTNNRIFSGLISVFAFSLYLLWIYYTNSNNLNYGVWIEIGWFTLGIVIALGINTLLIKVKKDIKLSEMLFAGVLITLVFIPIVFSLNPSPGLAAATASFVIISLFYPLALSIADIVQKILTKDEKKFYMFAIVGIFLFVLSKIFEIIK